MNDKVSQFKRRPGSGSQTNRGVEDFIAGAGKPVAAPPWEGLDDEDPRKLYNLRLTEAQKVKLIYIVTNTKFKSMQEFCMFYLIPAIDENIEKLAREQAL